MKTTYLKLALSCGATISIKQVHMAEPSYLATSHTSGNPPVAGIAGGSIELALDNLNDAIAMHAESEAVDFG